MPSGVERSFSNFEISAPDTKALPPAPVRTITRTSSSAANCSSMWAVASHISRDTALCRCGLLKMMVPTPPSLRESILSASAITVVSFILALLGVARGFGWRLEGLAYQNRFVPDALIDHG